MTKYQDEPVVKELMELKDLESQLQLKWKGLKRAGKGVQEAFLLSVFELQARASRLEQALDSATQRTA